MYRKYGAGDTDWYDMDDPTFDSIQFDTSAGGSAHSEGLLEWNATDGTLDIHTDISGTVLQVGQELFVRVENNEAYDITNGQVVYISGSSGSRPRVTRANASAAATADGVIGVATSTITSGSEGYITIAGLVRGVNTGGLTAGDQLYLDTSDGGFTTTPPSTATGAHLIKLGYVVTTDGSNGVILVRVDNGNHLGEIHDILLSSETSGDILSYDGSKWINSNRLTTAEADVDVLEANFTDMEEPNGFVDTDNTLSFVNGTRTLTITPSGAGFSYYSSGTKYTKTGAQDIIISNDEGLHYVYYNDATLTDATVWNESFISTYALVAIIYWDVSAGAQILLGNEQHGCRMDGKTHSYLHNTQGAKISSGGGISIAVPDTSTALGIEATTIWDEDIKHVHTADAVGTADTYIYNRIGADGDLEWEVSVNTGATQGEPYAITTTRPDWNELTGGSWQRTELSGANKYVLGHVFAMNDVDRKFGVIMGQSEYAGIKAAQDGALTEISSLVTNGLPTPEFVFLGTVIIDGNGVLRSTEDGDAYVDLRDFSFYRGNVSVNVVSHQDLGSLQGGGVNEYYHLDATEFGFLDGQDQALKTSDNVNFNQVQTDTIIEETADAGVTIDSALIKDGGFTGEIITDSISEETPDNGVSIDGVTVKDGGITATADVLCNAVQINDTNDSNKLTIKWGEDDTSDRSIDVNVGGGNRIATFNDDLTVNTIAAHSSVVTNGTANSIEAASVQDWEYVNGAHGFGSEDVYPIYNNAGTWTKAQADASATVPTHLALIVDPNNYYRCKIGRYTYSSTGAALIDGVAATSFVANTYYWCDKDNAGGFVTSAPSVGFDCPCFYTNSLTEIDVFVHHRGSAIGDGVASDSEVGVIMSYAGTSVPTGFLACEGQAVSRSTYAELFSKIGTTWGVGDGSTTFNLPDGRSGFLVGAGQGEQSEFVVKTNRSVGDYNHDAFQGFEINDHQGGYFSGTGSVFGARGAQGNGDAGQLTPMDDGTNGTPRTGTETVPNSLAVKFIIRYSPKAALQGVLTTEVTDISADTSLTIANIENNDIFNVTTGSSANVTVTLPEGTTAIENKPFKIIKKDSGTKFVEIARSGSDTIRGSATSIYAIQQYEAIELMWNGTEYQLLSNPYRTVSANIDNNGTASIVQQDCTWLSSVSRTSAGTVTVSINSGVFNQTPIFTGNTVNTTDYFVVFGSDPTTTGFTTLYTTKHDGSQADKNFMLVGVGLK